MMGKRFYKPWIGDNYRDTNPRLLILGESHYGPYASREDATIALTSEYVSGKMNHSFWTNTMNVVRGQSGNEMEARKAFWHQVAFYNFVQTSAGPTARIAPSETMFHDAVDAFFCVLDDLKPDCILVLSNRLWVNLPGKGLKSRAGKPLGESGETRETWIYDYDGGSALATPINHPSSYFSWPRWHKWVTALKAAAVQRRPPP